MSSGYARRSGQDAKSKVYWQLSTRILLKLSRSLQHPTLKQIAAELVFRSTLIPFSQVCWDLEMLNGHELPPGPCFIYGNHSGNYDPFIYNAFTRLGESTAGIMTMEYLESGPIAALFQAAGIQGTRKRVPEPHLIRRIYEMLDAGRRVVIFPEGGRRWDGRPAPWIESTAKLFMRAGAPVYPVEIIGSYVAWPRWAPWPRPAHVKVKVHEAVDFSDKPTLEEGMRRLKAPISADETLVPESVRPGWAFRPAVGLDRLLYRDPYTGEFGGVRVESGWQVSMNGGATRSRVLPDSRMQADPDSEPISTADLYETIRHMPLPDASSSPLLTMRASTWISGQSTLRAPQSLALYSDHVRWGDRILPLESIAYMGLERSDRIWLVSGNEQLNAYFPTGSVLAWYDTLGRLAPHINT